MPCLLTQLQKKLQLNYKTESTQKCQKIELYGSPTTKELKKSHSSRWVGEAETRGESDGEVQRGVKMWNQQSHIYVW